MLWCLIMGVTYLVLGPVTLIKLVIIRTPEGLRTRGTD